MQTNFSYKLLACTCIAVGFSANVAYAQNIFDSVVVTLEGGLMQGQAREYVLDPSQPVGGGNKDSELIWDYENVKMVGVTAELPINNMFSVKGEFWKEVGNNNGYMVDYDWIANAGSPGLGLTPFADDAWTDRSRHPDSPVKDAYNIDVQLAVSPFENVNILGNNVKMSGLVGYRKDHYHMTSFGGDYVYTSNGAGNFRDDVGVFAANVEGIDYAQDFETPYIGVKAASNLGRFNVAGEVTLGRYEVVAIDNHFSRNLQFRDVIKGTMTAAGLDVSTRIDDIIALPSNTSLNLSLDYLNYAYAVGTSTNRPITTGGSFGPVSANSSATSFRSLTYAVGLKIEL